MPRLVSSLPKYRLHKSSGQAVVTLCGTDIHLGSWRSKASRVEYDRFITEWMQNGRRLPSRGVNDLALVEVIGAYCQHADLRKAKARVGDPATLSLEHLELDDHSVLQAVGTLLDEEAERKVTRFLVDTFRGQGGRKGKGLQKRLTQFWGVTEGTVSKRLKSLGIDCAQD